MTALDEPHAFWLAHSVFRICGFWRFLSAFAGFRVLFGKGLSATPGCSGNIKVGFLELCRDPMPESMKGSKDPKPLAISTSKPS